MSPNRYRNPILYPLCLLILNNKTNVIGGKIVKWYKIYRKKCFTLYWETYICVNTLEGLFIFFALALWYITNNMMGGTMCVDDAFIGTMYQPLQLLYISILCDVESITFCSLPYNNCTVWIRWGQQIFPMTPGHSNYWRAVSLQECKWFHWYRNCGIKV